MLCPKCDAEQHCPCKNCAPRNKGRVTWVVHSDGECASCGHCGFSESYDGWMDIESDQHTAMLKANSNAE
jgi:hypothetical protein